MAEITQSSEVELDAKQGKIKVRGSDIISTGTLAVVLLVAYALWEHKSESVDTKREFVSAMKEMTLAQRENVMAQRVMNCLIATPERERETKLPTCERIAR